MVEPIHLQELYTDGWLRRSTNNGELPSHLRVYKPPYDTWPIWYPSILATVLVYYTTSTYQPRSHHELAIQNHQPHRIRFAVASARSSPGPSAIVASSKAASVDSAVSRLKNQEPGARIAGFVCDLGDQDALERNMRRLQSG